MEIHFLDIILYFVIAIIIWKILPNDLTEEIGGFIGIGIMLVYTIVYILLFGVLDLNWSDMVSNKWFNLDWKL